MVSKQFALETAYFSEVTTRYDLIRMRHVIASVGQTVVDEALEQSAIEGEIYNALSPHERQLYLNDSEPSAVKQTTAWQQDPRSQVLLAKVDFDVENLFSLPEVESFGVTSVRPDRFRISGYNGFQDVSLAGNIAAGDVHVVKTASMLESSPSLEELSIFEASFTQLEKLNNRLA